MAKAKPTIYDPNKDATYELDSSEEWDFYQWLLEGYEHGLIDSYTYHVKSYELIPKHVYEVLKQLKTKTKTIQKTLLRQHEYTPDFEVNVSEHFYEIFGDKTILTKIDHVSKNPYVIDIKGAFQRNGGSRSFAIDCKLMYETHGIYVFKVIPDKLFEETFLPERCKYTLKKKQLKKKYDNENYKRISEAVA